MSSLCHFDRRFPVAVFLGPTLPVSMARARLPANYYPPVAHGDVYRLIATGVRTILIIDGVFENRAPVWQREILQAIENGIRVVGAASMGALRAAELHPFGMQGVGEIYRLYRDGTIDGDDEVALLHGPAEVGYLALSRPLVNTRATLARAAEQGCLSTRERDALIGLAKRQCYAARTDESLLEAAVGLPAERFARLQTYLQTQTVDLKARDAVAALDYCAALDYREMPPEPVPVHWAGASDRFAEVATSQRGLLLDGGQLVSGAQVLERALDDPARRRHHWRRMARLGFLDLASRETLPDPDWQADRVARWAREHPVAQRREWLVANGLTEREFGKALARRARIEWSCRRQSRREVVLAWAERQGIRCAPPVADDTYEWLLAQGPTGVGFFSWCYAAELLLDLQLAGKAAELAAQCQ